MCTVSRRFDTLGCDHPEKSYRLGIMGGTFDPVHIGHLACAEQVRETFSLDAVIFVPAGKPVYKNDQDVTAVQKRLHMCELAVMSNPYFDFSPIEANRAGDTYTVDTLRQLRDHYPKNVTLYFISGADAIFSIMKWKDSASVVAMAHLIAVTRPGYIISEEMKQDIDKYAGSSITYTEVTALAISSSDLREKVRNNQSIRYLTMQNVHDYIHQEGLYLEKENECG